jgi:hydrogenase maturation factor
LILPAFANPALAQAEDQGRFSACDARLAFSTNAYVVTPLSFPGADIGKLAVAPEAQAQAALAALRAHPLGGLAEIIGRCVEDPDKSVRLRTRYAGWRMIVWLIGDTLPRIC